MSLFTYLASFVKNSLRYRAFWMGVIFFVFVVEEIASEVINVSESIGPITRVWITRRSNDSDRIVINWISDISGPSEVRFGETGEYGQVQQSSLQGSLHHVEISLPKRDCLYHYKVITGSQSSKDATIKSFPVDSIRIAVAANWQRRPDLSAILEDDPHMLITAGDHVESIWKYCGENQEDCIAAFIDLIDAYPKLFQSIPFMPVLGNHDREIRPRGESPPDEPVYDIDAVAFRKFFELPDEEWKWHLDLPSFELRLIALDLNHIKDFGTTWQSCHSFDEGSAQLDWYENLMSDAPRFTISLYNEMNGRVRNQVDGKWQELFRSGTMCISGYGHFAERAEFENVVYYNTALRGTGDPYPDPYSEFQAKEDNYILITTARESRKMVVAIKNLRGKVLNLEMF